MKKLIAILAVVFTMATATACEFDTEKLLSYLNPDNWGNEQVEDPEGDGEENEGESGNEGGNQGGNENEGEENNNVVSPITGGGDFNTGNNYND